jgi:hypothetical protein
MPNRDDYARIEITRNGGTVDVLSPYHPDFPKRAREIRGRWDKDRRVWVFPATSEAHARDLCVLCFGTDKGQPAKAIPKRERKPRKGASKSKGLAAYATDDLLAELRRRGVVPAAPAADEPILAPPEPAWSEPAPPAPEQEAFTL